MTDLAKKHALDVERLHLPHRIRVDALRVQQGECVVVCGPNGSGKSSLLRLLAGLENSYNGSILLDGRDITHLNRRQVAEKISLLPQRPQLSEGLTCSMIVSAARYRFNETTKESDRRAREILVNHDIGHLADRFSGEISGGQLQRVLLAALVAQNTPFLLVDEPANHLDPRHQVNTYRHLGALWREHGKGIILVSHDIRLAQLLGPQEDVRVLGVHEHQIIEDTYLNDPELAKKLSALYDVEFVTGGLAGGLSLRLPPFAPLSLSAKGLRP